MMDWFRSWHGAPTDNKWLVIGKRANVAPGIVSAIVWALFDYASQNEKRGSVEGFDIETYAAFSGFDEQQISAVINALNDKFLIEDNCFKSWTKRQPLKEDETAAERKRKQRERENVTQCHAVSLNVTTDKIRTEQKEKELPRGNSQKKNSELQNFTDFWRQFPRQRRGNREQTASAWRAAMARASPDEIMAGLTAYSGSDEVKTGFAKGAAAWLRADGWTADYSIKPRGNGNGTHQKKPTKSERLRLAADAGEAAILEEWERGRQAQSLAIEGPANPKLRDF